MRKKQTGRENWPNNGPNAPLSFIADREVKVVAFCSVRIDKKQMLAALLDQLSLCEVTAAAFARLKPQTPDADEPIIRDGGPTQ